MFNQCKRITATTGLVLALLATSMPAHALTISGNEALPQQKAQKVTTKKTTAKKATTTSKTASSNKKTTSKTSNQNSVAKTQQAELQAAMELAALQMRLDSICRYERSGARDSLLLGSKRATEKQVAFPEQPSLAAFVARNYDQEFVLVNYLYEASGVKIEGTKSQQSAPEQFVPITNMLFRELQRTLSLTPTSQDNLAEQVQNRLYTCVELCLKDSDEVMVEKSCIRDAFSFYNKARKTIERNEIVRNAKDGDDDAQYQMGTWYYNGENDYERDYEQAVDWWTKSAERQNAQAMACLAQCYEMGHGVARDSVKAVKLYDDAIVAGCSELIENLEVRANRGSVFCQMYLVHCYKEGKGVNQDDEKVIKYYTMAAEGDCREAQYDLGMYYMGKNDEQNAVKYFLAAAKHGDIVSMYWAGKLTMKSSESDQDKQQAFSYLLQAADAGHIEAVTDVAQCYLNGEGVQKNVNSAVVYLKKAAAQGNADACWMLAKAYAKGEGVSVHYEQALFWFARAVSGGHACSVKEEMQGDSKFLLYIEGMKLLLLEQDYENATKQFKALEKAGSSMGTIMMAAVLAEMDNVKRNPKKAIKSLEKVAATDSYAYYRLGLIYESGTEKNTELAADCFKKSADSQYGPSLCRMGEFYYVGNEYVDRSLDSAIKCFKAAWAQGRMTAKAVRRLSSCYEKGTGIAADPQKVEELKNVNTKDDIPALLQKL